MYRLIRGRIFEEYQIQNILKKSIFLKYLRDFFSFIQSTLYNEEGIITKFHSLGKKKKIRMNENENAVSSLGYVFLIDLLLN